MADVRCDAYLAVRGPIDAETRRGTPVIRFAGPAIQGRDGDAVAFSYGPRVEIDGAAYDLLLPPGTEVRALAIPAAGLAWLTGPDGSPERQIEGARLVERVGGVWVDR